MDDTDSSVKFQRQELANTNVLIGLLKVKIHPEQVLNAKYSGLRSNSQEPNLDNALLINDKTVDHNKEFICNSCKQYLKRDFGASMTHLKTCVKSKTKEDYEDTVNRWFLLIRKRDELNRLLGKGQETGNQGCLESALICHCAVQKVSIGSISSNTMLRLMDVASKCNPYERAAALRPTRLNAKLDELGSATEVLLLNQVTGCKSVSLAVDGWTPIGKPEILGCVAYNRMGHKYPFQLPFEKKDGPSCAKLFWKPLTFAEINF